MGRTKYRTGPKGTERDRTGANGTARDRTGPNGRTCAERNCKQQKQQHSRTEEQRKLESTELI